MGRVSKGGQSRRPRPAQAMPSDRRRLRDARLDPLRLSSGPKAANPPKNPTGKRFPRHRLENSDRAGPQDPVEGRALVPAGPLTAMPDPRPRCRTQLNSCAPRSRPQARCPGHRAPASTTGPGPAAARARPSHPTPGEMKRC